MLVLAPIYAITAKQMPFIRNKTPVMCKEIFAMCKKIPSMCKKILFRRYWHYVSQYSPLFGYYFPPVTLFYNFLKK
jgi:hypothetical protein